MGETVSDIEIDPANMRLVSLVGPMRDGWFTGDVLFSFDEIEYWNLSVGQTDNFFVSHLARNLIDVHIAQSPPRASTTSKSPASMCTI